MNIKDVFYELMNILSSFWH